VSAFFHLPDAQIYPHHLYFNLVLISFATGRQFIFFRHELPGAFALPPERGIYAASLSERHRPND
jgi:hypothetical protein